MTEHRCVALDGSDPLGFLAALGTLRVVSLIDPEARLRWVHESAWFPILLVDDSVDVVEAILNDLQRWRDGHAALDFANGADGKIQDLKHPPADFRALMRTTRTDREASSFIASYGTGVAVDSSGQTKPTSFHFTAARQRFMDAILTVRDTVTMEDVHVALQGPWVERACKHTRWRAASERSRALLSYDPEKADTTAVVAAVWLAFQAMPLFPTAPIGRRIVTPGFEGRPSDERFTWPLWTPALTRAEARILVGVSGNAALGPEDRLRRGISAVFRSKVLRSAQGYGNFAAATPV